MLTAVSNSVMMYVNGANLFLWFFNVVFELYGQENGVCLHGVVVMELCGFGGVLLKICVAI